MAADRIRKTIERMMRARRAGANGKAIAHLQSILGAVPDRIDLRRLYLRLLDGESREREADAALIEWCGTGDEVSRVEAMALVADRRRRSADPKERAEQIVAVRRAGRMRRAAATRTDLDPVERARMLIAFDDAGGAIDALAALPPERVGALPGPMVRDLLDRAAKQGRARAFASLFGPSAEHLPRQPAVLETLLAALQAEGADALALDVLGGHRETLSRSERARRAEIELLETVGRPAEAAARLADWKAEDPDSAELAWWRLQAIAAGRPAAGDAEGDMPGLARRALGAARVPGKARLVCDLMQEAGAPSDALDVAIEASERFPDDPVIQARLHAAALLVAGEETFAETRRRAVLDREIDHAVRDIVGRGALQEAGGPVALREALIDAFATPGDAAGPTMLARMFERALQAKLRSRKGRRREARELWPRGAAHWAAERGRAEGAAEGARLFSALALRADPGDREAALLLLRVQTSMPAGAAWEGLSGQLCRLLIDQGPEASRLPALLTAALSLDDPDLWDACLGLVDGSRRPRIVRAAGAPDGDGQLDPGRDGYRVRIHVAGPAAGDAGEDESFETDLTLPAHLDAVAKMDGARIHPGFLLERPDGTTARYGFDPDDRLAGAVVLASGSRASILDASAPETPVREPVLVVPGQRQHFVNYFHFAGQVLPRIRAHLDAEAERGAHPKVVLPDFLPDFARALLDAAGIGPDRILEARADRVLVLEDARVATPTTADWQCPPDQLVRLRAALALAPRDPARPGRRRLFLCRTQASTKQRGRVLANEGALRALAEGYGFEMIDPGQMSIDAQRALFAETEAICGATGAAMTNALYLPEDAHVICLSPHETCRTYFPGLVAGSGIRFHWVLGAFEPEFAGSSGFPHLPFGVPEARLEAALRKLDDEAAPDGPGPVPS